MLAIYTTSSQPHARSLNPTGHPGSPQRYPGILREDYDFSRMGSHMAALGSRIAYLYCFLFVGKADRLSRVVGVGGSGESWARLRRFKKVITEDLHLLSLIPNQKCFLIKLHVLSMVCCVKTPTVPYRY